MFIGKYIINGQFSIAMLVYWRVRWVQDHYIGDTRQYAQLYWLVPVSYFRSPDMGEHI